MAVFAVTNYVIPDIGSPPDDPTLELDGVLFVPDTPGPYNCIVGTVDGTFTRWEFESNHLASAQDWAEKGFLTLLFHVRARPTQQTPTGLPGQTTDGLAPSHTDDFKIGVRYMRSGGGIETVEGFSVTGFVGGWGGSGSAWDCMFAALTGTVGDDRLDAAVCMSPPTDGGDPDLGAQHFNVISQYLDESDPAAMRLLSPISQIDDHDFRILHFNGDHESIEITQFTLMQTAMTLFGATATEYESHLNTGELGRRHSYGMWGSIKDTIAIPWMEARAAEWADQEPPPPPEDTGRVKVTAIINGMSPDVAMQLHVTPINTISGLRGPERTFDFTSDPAQTGGGGNLKAPPTGVFALINAPNGVPDGGPLADRAYWNYAYVDGVRFPARWRVVNGTSKNSFSWDPLDAFLDLCADNDKMGGISMSCGIHCPDWIYTAGNVVGFEEHGPNAGLIPLPWDQNYLKGIKNLVVTMAARYDARPELGYIVVGGLGQILETLIVTSMDYAALNALAVAAGYVDVMDGWRFGALQIMDMWIKSFRTTHCYLAIEHPVPAANGGLTGIDSFTRGAVQRYKQSLGITNFGLDGLTAATQQLSLNKIIKSATRSARGYQFFRPSTDPACDPSQDPVGYDPEQGLQNAANAGIAIGVQMEEFYEADILTTTSNYPTHFATFQTDLIANAVP